MFAEATLFACRSATQFAVRNAGSLAKAMLFLSQGRQADGEPLLWREQFEQIRYPCRVAEAVTKPDVAYWRP